MGIERLVRFPSPNPIADCPSDSLWILSYSQTLIRLCRLMPRLVACASRPDHSKAIGLLENRSRVSFCWPCFFRDQIRIPPFVIEIKSLLLINAVPTVEKEPLAAPACFTTAPFFGSKGRGNSAQGKLRDRSWDRSDTWGNLTVITLEWVSRVRTSDSGGNEALQGGIIEVGEMQFNKGLTANDHVLRRPKVCLHSKYSTASEWR
jgi:hypothetical protein